MYSSLFWKDTFERLIATLAQVLITLLSVDGLDLLNLDFAAVGTSLLIAGGLVVLKAIVAANVSKTVSPASLAKDGRGL